MFGFKRIVAGLILGIILLGASAQPADASTPLASTALTATVHAVDTDQQELEALTSKYLTIDRWSEAMSQLFMKREWNDVVNIVADSTNRNVVQTAVMGAATAGWNFAAATVKQAATLEFVRDLGKGLDDVVAGILSTIVAPQTSGKGFTVTIFGWLIIAALITIAFGALTRLRGKHLVIRIVGVAALAGYMIFASTALISNRGSTASPYSPAVGTPSWIALTLSDSVGAIADIPAKAMLDTIGSSEQASYVPVSDLNCLGFTGTLKTIGDSNAEGVSAEKVQKGYRVTQIVDQIWQKAGIKAYTAVQTGDSNPYGKEMFCRILEIQSSSISSANSAYITGKSLNPPHYQSGSAKSDSSLLMFNARTTDDKNMAFVGWAACKYDAKSGSWTVKKEWTGFNTYTGDLFRGGDSSGLNDAACTAWATAKYDAAGRLDDKGALNAFKVIGTGGDIATAVASTGDNASLLQKDQIKNFLETVMGVNSSGSSLYAITYMAMSIFGVIPLFLLAGLTLLARLMVVGFLFSSWFILIVALFSANPFQERIFPMLKKLLSSTMLAYGATMLLAMVAIFSYSLTSLVSGEAVPATVAIGWACLAPALALVMVHLLFVKGLGLASPLTVKGMSSWSNASPMVGAALGSGVGSFAGSRLGQHARRLGGKAVSSATGGRLGTGSAGLRRGMKPVKGDSGSVDAAKTAAAAGLITGAASVATLSGRAGVKQVRQAAFGEYLESTGVRHELDRKGRKTDYRSAIVARKSELKEAAVSRAGEVAALKGSASGRAILAGERAVQREKNATFKRELQDRHQVGAARAARLVGERAAQALALDASSKAAGVSRSEALRVAGRSAAKSVLGENAGRKAAILATSAFVAGPLGVGVAGATIAATNKRASAKARDKATRELAAGVVEARKVRADAEEVQRDAKK